AGATGLGAARAARNGGRRVALVDGARPGGDCTHYGCVPSKTLIETARLVAGARAGSDRGLDATVDVDFAAVMKHVHAVIADIEQDESPALLARQGIDLVPAYARFVAPDTIEADGRRISAERFVIATGGRAAIPPVDGLTETPYLDNKSVFSLTEQPEHLLILGGGPIGCELAQAYRRLGSRVTIVQSAGRLSDREEPEASRILREVFEREGIDVRLGAKAVKVSAGPTVHLSDGTTVGGSHLLVATGRQPVTDGLDLQVPGVTLDERGRVVTDAYLQTSVEHIYAAGDVTSRLQFTHVGDDQGRLAVGNAFAKPLLPGLLGGRRKWDERVIPKVTYTEPEIGSVGLTEAQAFAEYGEKALVAFIPMSAMDRPRCAGETDGFVKLIAAPRPILRAKPLMRLVGMTAMAAVGGELVGQGALAMSANTLVARLALTEAAYPTWSMAVRFAAAQFFGTYGGRTARAARGDRG
ncbi:MAG: FAD-dependent oxidoreductase, partial [Actinomycetota bacterium]|nr:FAD-dependent oxidoreductase [Actinomycetota bacterium]